MMIQTANPTHNRDNKPRVSFSFVQTEKGNKLNPARLEFRKSLANNVINEEDEFCSETNLNLITYNHLTTPHTDDNDLLHNKNIVSNNLSNLNTKLELKENQVSSTPRKTIDSSIARDRFFSKIKLKTFNTKMFSKRSSAFPNTMRVSIFKNLKSKGNFKWRPSTVGPATLYIQDQGIKEIIDKKEANNLNLISNFTKTIGNLQVMISILVFINILLSVIDNILFSQRFENEIIKVSQNITEPIKVYTRENLDSLTNLEISLTENMLRTINFVIIIIINILTFKTYSYSLEIQKYYMYCDKEDSLYSSGMFMNLVLEVCIMSIFYPPYLKVLFLEESLTHINYYSLNSLCLYLVFLKLYSFFRTFAYFTKWLTEDNVAVCNKYIGTPGIIFASRSTYKQSPIQVITIAFVIMIFLFGLMLNLLDFAVFVKENDKFYHKVDKGLDLSIWIIVETCSTLGYGEITPVTYLGKLSTVLSGLAGWFIISLLIIVAGDMLALNAEEHDAYILYKKRRIKEKTEVNARRIIIQVLLYRMVLMTQFKRNTFPFLLANKIYDIFYFSRITDEKKKNLLKKLRENDYEITSDAQNIIDKINPIFLNFYNKIICLNTINSECLNFVKVNKFLNSFLPSTNEQMNRLSKSIGDNFNRLDDYITNKLTYFRDEFNDLIENTKSFNNKIQSIIDVQNKIAEIYVRINNQIQTEN